MSEFRCVRVADGCPSMVRALVRAMLVAADQKAEFHFVRVLHRPREWPAFDACPEPGHALESV